MAERIDLGKVSLIPRGQHFPDVEYKRLHWVTDAGNSYVYINPAPSTGALLTSTEHWMLFAQRGAKVISGTFANDVFTFVLDDGSTFDVEYAGVTAATQAAVDAAALANEKATLANDKAILADGKATLANQAAVDVTQAIQSTEAATLSALEAQDANANWTKDGRNPAEYFPAPSAPLYFRREGTFTQEGSGDPSPTNIRPITPFMANGAQIVLRNSGKNLLNLERSLGHAGNESADTVRVWDDTKYYLGITVTNISNPVRTTYSRAGSSITVNCMSAGYGVGFPIKCMPSTAYTIQKGANEDVRVAYYTADGVYVSNSGVLSGLSLNITTPVNIYWMVIIFRPSVETTFVNPQIELGSFATPYEPYVGSTSTLTAPEEIAAGWINNRGEGQATWARKVFDGNETIGGVSSRFIGDVVGFWTTIAGIKLIKDSEIACSHFVRLLAASTVSIEGVMKHNTFADISIGLLKSHLTGWNDGWNDQEKMNAFKAYLASQYAAGTPVTVVYQLATPATITPVTAPLNTIPALDLATERLNVFTSSLSGVLTYPKNKVRQDRILNNAQLWRRTASGNPVSAYPVPESPLYPKISGTSTQSGTGDPSPSNIRPITPWLAQGARVLVNRTGKNLLPSAPNTLSVTITGVTGTWGTDGSVTLTGTASADISLWVVGGGTENAATFTLPPGQYTLTPSKAGVIPYLMPGYTTGTFTLTQATVFHGLYLAILNGTATNVIYYPQLERGASTTAYESYSGTRIALTAPSEIPAGWMDNEGNGQATWARKVFDGTETVAIYRAEDWTASYIKVLVAGVTNAFSFGTSYQLSSHFKYGGVTSAGYQPNQFIVGISGGNVYFGVEIAGVTDVATFKTWLAAQYTAGTPVTIYYQIATPATLTPAIAPLTATPQLDRITPRQNVLTASTGNIELTYAKSPTRESDEIRAAIIAHGGTL